RRRRLAHVPPQRAAELVVPAQVGGAGERVDEPAFVVPHLHEPELRDVARDGGLNGLDAARLQRIRDFRLRGHRLLLHEPQDRALPFELRRHRSSFRIAMPCTASSCESVSGGVSRIVFGPAEPITRPRASAASTTSPAGCSVSNASSSPRPRASNASTKSCEISFTCASTAHAAALVTRLPPNVEAWSPGANAVGASSETSNAPIGRPFARPFASVTASGLTPASCHAKNEPERPTPVWTSSKTSSAPCSSASARACARNSCVIGCTPPS